MRLPLPRQSAGRTPAEEGSLMHKRYPATLLGVTTLLAMGCGSALADKPHGHGAMVKRPAPNPVEVAPPVAASPYKMELVDAAGQLLPTYLFKGRFYVMGAAGTRYGVRLSNPTDQRVEAVISVDGLDALDGEDATSQKRGYIVPPRQTITVEGFRVSLDDVATFRFSSVSNSYAGRKGKARNVGVVGVAFFREREPQPVAIPVPYPDPYPYPPPCPMCKVPSGGGGATRGGGDDEGGRAESAPDTDAPRQTTTAPGGGQNNKHAGNTRPADPHTHPTMPPREDVYRPAPKERPGLGTEYGERRSAPVIRVGFQRESPNPCCIVQLRYNDRSGLVALGIPLGESVDHEEVWTRETADPFPAGGFSAPPPNWNR